MVVYIDPTQFNRTCPRCQANVHGTETPSCPECGGSMVPACINCGYDLAGLPRDGLCPECGTLVAQSYAPDLLENRSVEFLTQLHSGLRIVLVGLLCQVGITVLSIGIAIGLAFMSSSGAQLAFSIVVQLLTMLVSLAILFGWWRITAPDPGRIGGGLDVKPRQVVRIAVVVQLAAALIALALQPFVGTSNTIDFTKPLDVMYGAVGLVSLAAWCTQFFASMLYVRWLARRIPDSKLEADAKRFMWLGPLLYILLACVLVGPIVALVMYWLMLNSLRQHITAILSRLGAI